jgi:C1A family cysteine protease
MTVKKYFIVGFITLIFGLGLFWWSTSQLKRVYHNYTIKQDFSYIPEGSKCNKWNDILLSEFMINYPTFIWLNKTDEINVTISKPKINSGSEYIAKSSELCTIYLEVRVDSKGMAIEPGKRSFEAYSDKRTQNYIFNITPIKTQLMEGTIWIHANISHVKSEISERIPLFAIPFKIQVKSIFGISF